MKRKLHFYLVFVFLTVGTLRSFAYSDITIKNLKVNAQLPANTVYRAYQDTQGYIWLATPDGACRYDGNQLLTFRSNVENPNLLKSNEVLTLANDSCNQLWIGTTKGVNLLNLNDYSISAPLALDTIKGIVSKIKVTTDKSIWIGTSTGLYRYSSDFKTIVSYQSAFKEHEITDIYEDPQHNIWVLSDACGIFKYIKENDSFENFPKIGVFNKPYRIYQDTDQVYWVCTWGDGVYRFNPNAKNGEYYFHYNINNVNMQEYDCSFSIVQDSYYGYLWVMSLSGVKAFTYDKQNDQIIHKNVDFLFNKTNNIFSEFTKDKNGNIWIGGYNEGVYLISFDKQTVRNIPLLQIKSKTNMTPNINALNLDSKNNLWFNQERIGLGWYNTVTNQISFYYETSNIKDLRKLENVTAIRTIHSRQDEAWVAPRDERLIHRFKLNQKRIERLEHIDLKNYTESYISDIYEDNFENVWITTNLKYPLMVPKGSTKIKNIPYDFGAITKIKEDTNGYLWIATSDNGTFQLHLDTNGYSTVNMTHYPQPSEIKHIRTIDIGKDKIWIGTAEGAIFSLDKINSKVIDYSKQIGFLNEAIQYIICDIYDNVWIGTNRKIIRYTPEYNSYQEYTNENNDLIIDSFRERSYHLTPQGNLLIGGNNGIASFETKRFDLKEQSNTAVITNIKINNTSILSHKSNNQFFPIKNQLILNPEDKYIEIDFSTLNYSQPHKILYRYKIQGIDKDWIYTTSDRPFAYYNELPKGNHTLSISVTDENKVWSSVITHFNIIRKPAYYETDLAYFFYSLFILTSIIFVLYRIKRRYTIKNELRFAEIEKANIQELAQTKLQYFTNISHEFLTPLTIITCVIDDLEMTNTEHLQEFSIMRTNTNRLRRLLQQILDFRKIENNRMDINIQQTDLVTFLNQLCYSNFLPLIKHKSIDFVFSSEKEHIPAYIDEDKLDKIMYNILSNAFKYTPERGLVHVEIETKVKNLINYVVIRISDSGIGIAKEELDLIFTPFYSNKQKLVTNTNGLGLSLVKSLTELLHGSISVKSIEGKGSTFTIELPIDESAFVSAPANPETTLIKKISLGAPNELNSLEVDNNTSFSDSTKDKAKILLVEDNEDLLTIMSRILSRKYNIYTATNGVDALRIIEKQEVHLIISDVMMPHMDGWELCRKIKQNIETSDIPIILLTAKIGAENQIESYKAGANGYLSKPFDLKLLESRIDNFLETQKRKQKDFKQSIQLNIDALESTSIDQQFLKDLVNYIESNINDVALTVDNLGKDLNLSRSTLYRKIKSLTNQSPVEFIRNIRLKHASVMLSDESVNISEVAYAVGFSDPKYFSKCFKSEFGLTPSEYAKK